ncbi:uncharacterized protein K452DRAFT_287439 [Aplosporella prunicola CBS 121167]|uniref:Uncharacterized protein n=1 Tax=Aplosporella prunicola CBS 121167 TaxID=1176127 RepID=A0A6A6BDF8_9PEZI|nr:uncharacterized protein K452DRAFT_287439 [Aplosporella prunicola CBS 121167]KAF2142222.1 hypothetical protein K452DRAFT_287439 [Aplosporella prunicola CBS 121167]
MVGDPRHAGVGRGFMPRNYSHGRGGAGNIGKPERPSSLSPRPTDLATPTIKAPTYTTGRGGSGNMARNDPTRPELARAAQDVGPSPGLLQRGGSGVATDEFHYGRGGAANVGRQSEEEEVMMRAREGKEGEARVGGAVLPVKAGAGVGGARNAAATTATTVAKDGAGAGAGAGSEGRGAAHGAAHGGALGKAEPVDGEGEHEKGLGDKAKDLLGKVAGKK